MNQKAAESWAYLRGANVVASADLPRQRFAGALLLSLGLHGAIVFGVAFLPVTPKIQPSPILEAVLIPPTAQPRSVERGAPTDATESSEGTAIPAADGGVSLNRLVSARLATGAEARA